MLTKVELLPAKLGDENYKKLTLLWKCKQLQALDVTERIIDLANQIRSFYAEKKEQVPTTPDSVHLATAIIAKVDVFQTFDGTGKRGLLKLDGNVAGHSLAIKTPFVPQAILNFPPQPSK